MQTAEFNEWDFYPVNLSPNEVSNPLSVFQAFFYDDWLPDQVERLKEWRDFVLKDEFYTDAKKSPFGLLYFHKLNICLIEAAHLIKGKGENSGIVQMPEILKSEHESWRDYPNNLKEDELLNPNIVVDDFFNAYNLPQYRALLYEWLEYGLSAKAANEFIETVHLITVYENLQKLYSAAWLILQRSAQNPYLKEISNGKSEINGEAVSFLKDVVPVCLYKLNTAISAGNKALFGKLVSKIKHKVPSVQAIIYLGVLPYGSEKIFLLILTANDEQRQAQSLGTTIEESCIDLACIVALVHHASNLHTGVNNGNRFFNQALTCPAIYLSGDLILPLHKPLSFCAANDCLINYWDRWHSQSKEFLSGANYYLLNKAYGACLFSLHQCVECLLIALVRSILGYRINNHNLSKLLNITQMFTPDLVNVFNLENMESSRLFDLLKHAYVNVRYKENFEADAGSVTGLFGLVKQLMAISEKVHERYLLTRSI